MADSRSSLASIQHHVLPLNGTSGDYDALLAKAASRRFILLGEASHGTHDFYTARAEITRRMIEEQGIDAVVVEGDWPDVYRINRFVRGLGGDASARCGLGAQLAPG
ncbi:erythromycin esterase family protein [Microbulbifer sp. SH-1]|uniref:erythromycin esterase family protein n=1 Tax=Microbulbifer sp. SH-1 TaxID=2681547 RepID=UPI00197C8050|nr:erythromycin esterase family protein [Microbulbifer sp. SH-1]